MIDINDITSNVQINDNTVTGDGLFDKLMASITTHVENQFDQGRIKGTDYANVYLGSIQSVIAESTRFILQEENIEAQTILTNRKAI